MPMARRVAGDLGDLGGVQQRLGRDAAAVQARAADLVLLDERDRLAELGSAQGRRVAAAAAAQDDQIEGVVGHRDASPAMRRMSVRTVAAVGPLSVKPNGAALVHADTGDVEVHPRDARSIGLVARPPDEVPEEQSGEQRAAGRVADLGVLEVGDGGVELVHHVRRKRKLPGELARLGGGREVLGDRGVVAHDAGVAGAERDRDRAGQGRDVDDQVGMLAARGDQTVGEDESALRVGVEHLDRRAVERCGATSPGRVARPDGMLSAMHSHAVTFTGAPMVATARRTARAVAAPHMSYFMPTIEAAGLSERPPVSKVMPLPTSATWRVASAGEYSRRTRRGGRSEPCPTPRMPPYPPLAQRLLVEHLDRHGQLRDRRDRALGEVGGAEPLGGRRDEILHQRDRRRPSRSTAASRPDRPRPIRAPRRATRVAFGASVL